MTDGASAASSAGPVAGGPGVRQRAEQGHRHQVPFHRPAVGAVGQRHRVPHFMATRKVPGWPTLGSRLASEITRGGTRPIVV